MGASNEDIGSCIRRARKVAGYSSASAVAKKLGIPQTSFYSYETGHVSLPLSVAWELADLYQCSLDELVGRDFVPSADDNESQLVGAYRSTSEVGQALILDNAQIVSERMPKNAPQSSKRASA